MKALILDGGREGDELTAAAVAGTRTALEAAGFECETVAGRELAIAPCRGCFGCWTRTPGECVIRDASADVVRSYLTSTLVAYVAPVTFGGYSAELKKMVDRIIPVLDPRFTTVHGEVHHRLRYDRYPRLLVVGTLPSPDAEAERVFGGLVARNSLNMHLTDSSALIVHEADARAVRTAVAPLLGTAEVAA
jgi:multimeric flavodoxin WrbA